MTLEQLYQEKILALARLARATPPLDDAPLVAEAKNPVCGDRVRVGLTLNAGGAVQRIGAAVDGCVLCEAAAGLLLTSAPGRAGRDLCGLDAQITAWLTDADAAPILDGQDAFTPVKAFTSRHRCISLPFEAAAKALKPLMGRIDPQGPDPQG